MTHYVNLTGLMARRELRKVRAMLRKARRGDQYTKPPFGPLSYCNHIGMREARLTLIKMHRRAKEGKEIAFAGHKYETLG